MMLQGRTAGKITRRQPVSGIFRDVAWQQGSGIFQPLNRHGGALFSWQPHASHI